MFFPGGNRTTQLYIIASDNASTQKSVLFFKYLPQAKHYATFKTVTAVWISELVPGVWKIFKFQWTLTFLSCHQLLCKGFRYNQQRIGHSRSLNVIIYFRFSGILFLKFMNKALPRSNTLSEAFCINIKCSIIIITLCMSADWYSSVIYGHVLAQIPLFLENDVYNSWYCSLWLCSPYRGYVGNVGVFLLIPVPELVSHIRG